MRILKRVLIGLVALIVLVSGLVIGLTLSGNGTPVPIQVRPNAWPLYPDGAPPLPDRADAENWIRLGNGVLAAYNVTDPTLEPFLPEPAKATGTAVVIAPGGASVTLAINIEGWDVARWFADHGVAAFVLKYRTRPSPANPFARVLWSLAQMPKLYKGGKFVLSPFQPAVDDGMAALRVLRARAAEFGIDPERIGMIGFSAGAITTLAVVQQADAAARPAFAGLIYGPLDAAVVPRQPPPLFLAIAADDPFAKQTDFGLIGAWKDAGAPVEFQKYPSGGHGFGLGLKGTDTEKWPGQFVAWLRVNHLLGSRLVRRPLAAERP